MVKIKLRGRLRETALRAIERAKGIAEEQREIARMRREKIQEVEEKLARKAEQIRETKERIGERIARLRRGYRRVVRPVSVFRERRDIALGKLRGHTRDRRRWAELKERARKEWLKQWGRGEDNRFTGRYAPKWKASGDWGRPKRKRRKEKKKKPWWEGKGLW